MKKELKIKRIIVRVSACLLCMVMTFSFSGCSPYDFIRGIVDTIQGEDGPGQTQNRADALRKEYSETLMKSIICEDTNSIRRILCPKSQDISDIEEQIKGGLDFIEGSVSEYTVAPAINGQTMAWDYGVITMFGCYGDILNIKTDAGKEYEISFFMYYIVENKDRKGITNISITDTNGNEDYEDNTYYRIGYGWKEDYYYDASVVAYNALKAISDGDMENLKKSFCARSVENEGFESQAQAAFEFFDGNATFGQRVRPNGEIYSDGDHDFRHSSLTDDVVIENYEETSVYTEVTTENIETDSGKVYQMEWSAYLKNDGDKTKVGIICLTLIDGDNRCTIGQTIT